MNTIGLGNALVDVLLKLENDDVLAEVGIQKGAMDMINQEQMIKIRKSQEGLERSQAPGGSSPRGRAKRHRERLKKTYSSLAQLVRASDC